MVWFWSSTFATWSKLWPQSLGSDGPNLGIERWGRGTVVNSVAPPANPKWGVEEQSRAISKKEAKLSFMQCLEGGGWGYPCWTRARRNSGFIIYEGNRSQQIHSAHMKYFKRGTGDLEQVLEKMDLHLVIKSQLQ